MTDPYRAYRFKVQIDGIEAGGFQSVGGLERTSKIEPYREGGVNDFEHQFVTQTTYPPLKLKKGLVDDILWNWHREVIDGTVVRRNITIVLQDDSNNDVWSWICEKAYPSKWTGGELDATANAVSTESIEFVHHGLTKQ